MRTGLSRVLLATSLAGVLAAGSALAQPAAPTAAPCAMPGLQTASISMQVAETFIVPFAPNSAELSPVAERVLDIAAASYPQQPTLYLRIQGGEPASQTETLVKLDRLTWVTAYLAQRDVPLEAIMFEEPSLAQQTGCASPVQAAL